MSNETIIEKTYALLKYVLPLLNKFPRSQKFILADKIEMLLIELLELYTEAYYGNMQIKIEKLTAANRKLEVVRLLIRLCHDMLYISTKQYENLSIQLLEIGNNTGAWLKSMVIKQ